MYVPLMGTGINRGQRALDPVELKLYKAVVSYHIGAGN